ncbi:MAG: M12 family metallopeptidase [Phycisphaerales bacterium]
MKRPIGPGLLMALVGVVIAGQASIAHGQNLEKDTALREERLCKLPPQLLDDSRSLWEANLWESGIVYYEFDGNTTAGMRSDMRAAMDRLEEAAFLRFLPRASQADYLHILDDTGNFVEHIGNAGGRQDVHIYNWNITYKMAHELMHAIGVRHEQARSDRDQFVSINYENIQAGWESQYNVQTGTPVGRFDFDSVMCYGPCSASICCPPGFSCGCSGEECWTIVAHSEYEAFQSLLGQRDHLSSGDISGLLSRYGPSATQWYRFDDGVPGTTATLVTDSGTAGLDGTASGSATYSGSAACFVPSEGVSLSMTNGAVAIGAPFPFNAVGNKTIAFWMFSPVNSHGALVWGRTGLTDSNRFHIYTNSDGTIGHDFREPSGALHCLSGNCGPSNGVPVPRNTWAHFMLVREGSTYRCYVNGVLARTTVDASVNFPNSPNWALNGRSTGLYVGLIDDLRFYDEAMTPDQVILTPIAPQVRLMSGGGIFCTDDPDATVSVLEVSGTGPFAYQWRKDAVNLIDDGHITGATTDTLHLDHPVASDAGNYSCVVSNCSGSATSASIAVLVCAADFNCDGFVNGDDYDSFASMFEAGDAGADINGDGFVNGDDYDAFASAFEAGC